MRLPNRRLKPLSATTVLVIASTWIAANSCATQGHLMTRNLVEGNEAALKGDYTTAVERYEAALNVVPDSAPAKRNLGIVFVKIGNFKRAKKTLIEVLPHYPRDVEVLYFLGEAHRGLEEFSLAASLYHKALRLEPGDTRVVKALAWTWYKVGNYDKSLAAVMPILRTTPTDLQARLIAGSVLNKQKKYQTAVDILSVVEKSGFNIHSQDKVTADSERALLISSLADAYAGLDSCARANSLYGEVLKTRPFLAQALVGSAKCDMKGENSSRALAKLERAVKSDPDHQEAHFLLGKLFEKVDANKAIFYYRRFLLLARDKSEFSNEIQITQKMLSSLERKTTTR